MIEFFNKLKKTNAKKKIVKVPVVLQMEATECGAACLSMILAHFGRWIPLEILRRDCGVSRDGSKAGNIVKAARIHGCVAKGYKLTCDNMEAVLLGEQMELPEQLRNITFPLIIHWEFNHFVVLEGIKDGKVYLNDPAIGHRTVSWDEFRTSYTGICIHITPADNFQKKVSGIM